MDHITTADDSEPFEPSALASGAELPASATILLVEDEPLVRKAAAEALQSAGYEVLTACNGAQALQLCSERSCRLNLLLCDIVMPGMNGCELAGAFQLLCPQAPVLLMSGYARELSSSLLSSAPYLSKPFSANALLHAVRELLNPNPTVTEVTP